MKSNTTPRQMRDGQWSYGSVSARPSGHPSTLVIACILVGVCLAIVFGALP